MPVQLEEDGSRAVLMRIARGEIPDDEGLALLDFDGNLAAGLQPIEKACRWNDGGVAVQTGVLGEIEKHLRVEEVRKDLLLGGMPLDPAGKLIGRRIEIGLRKLRARPAGDRLGMAGSENLLLNGFRPAALRATEHPLHHLDNALRVVERGP
jgi:hypothetical protein